jgi:hypothetical protein
LSSDQHKQPHPTATMHPTPGYEPSLRLGHDGFVVNRTFIIYGT